MFYHGKIQNFKIDLKLSKLCSKLLQNSLNFQIRVYFLVYGVGPVFWVWTGLLPDLTQKSHLDYHHIQHLQPSCKPTTSSCLCASRVFQIGRAVCSSLVCLCHGSVYCAISMPDVLRSVPACQQMSQMSWRPWCCATVPDGSCSSSYTRLYSWFSLFACNDDIKFVSLSHVTVYWLCLSPFIV